MIDIRVLGHKERLFTVNENMNKFSIGDSIIFEGIEYKVLRKIHIIGHDYFTESLKANSEIEVVKAD